MPRGRGRPKKETQGIMEDADHYYVPLDQLDSVDISDRNIEKYANGFFVGKQFAGSKEDVRKVLEDKVINKVGKKGKVIVDKLFELINGVFILEKGSGMGGNDPRPIRYYKTPPNINAIAYALDRVLGKPKQVNIQGNFSLSKLLVESRSNQVLNEPRRDDNQELYEESDLLHKGDLESKSAAS